MTETPQEIDSGIVIRLDTLLADRKMTLIQLAEAVGLHVNSVSRLKNGDISFIRLDTLGKICRALNCQPGDLLTYAPSS
jgi:putative transcriptional regulator